MKSDFLVKLINMFLFVIVFFGGATYADNQTIDLDASLEGKEFPEIMSLKAVSLSPESVQNNSGKIVYLYKKKNKLVFYKAGKEQVINDKYTKKYWLKSSGNYIYAFWWEKYAKEYNEKTHKTENIGKTLYVRVSTDNGKTFSDKVRINDKNGKPLTDLDIVIDDKGNATIFYLDERYSGLQVFVNTTNDGGNTWSKDLMLNNAKLNDSPPIKFSNEHFSAHSPRVEKIGDEIIVVWQQFVKGEGRFLFSRRSVNNGKTWSDESIIFNGKDKSAEISLFSIDTELYLVASYPENGLYLFVSTDGLSWRKVSGVAPNTTETGFVSFVRADADKKNLYISFVYKAFNTGFRDWHTGLVRYDIKKGIWKKGFYQFDATLRKENSRGSYQDIRVLNNGAIVAVWQDYRRILPAIFCSYSNDYGETWSTPFPLHKLGGVLAEHPFLKEIEENILVFYENNDLPEGKRPIFSMKILKLNSKQLPSYAMRNISKFLVTPSLQELKSKLKARFNDVMQARIAKQWEKAWTFVDPVYRNLYSKKSWLFTRDRIHYKSFELSSIDINMPYATIKGKAVFDLGENIQGLDATDEKFKNMSQGLEMKWGWFGDNWYYISDDPRSPYMP